MKKIIFGLIVVSTLTSVNLSAKAFKCDVVGDNYSYVVNIDNEKSAVKMEKNGATQELMKSSKRVGASSVSFKMSTPNGMDFVGVIDVVANTNVLSIVLPEGGTENVATQELSCKEVDASEVLSEFVMPEVKTHTCSDGENFTFEVAINDDGASITDRGQTVSNCNNMIFTKEIAQNILSNKMSNLSMATSNEEILAKAKDKWKQELDLAVNGVLVMCKVSPMQEVGMIVNGENSFYVSEGGSAYFELSPAKCD